jgi:hypothetical protein
MIHPLLSRVQLAALDGAGGEDAAKEAGLPLDPLDRKAVLDQMHALSQRMMTLQAGPAGPAAGSILNPAGFGGIAGPQTAPQLELAQSLAMALLAALGQGQEDSPFGAKKKLRFGPGSYLGTSSPDGPQGGGGGGIGDIGDPTGPPGFP